MSKRIVCRAVFAIALAGLALSGCEVDDPCDPGWTYEYGVCSPPPAPTPDAGGDGDGDGDLGDDDAGSAGDAGEVDAAMEDPGPVFICPVGGDRSVFERPCTTHADCECPATICLPEPFSHCAGTQCMEPGKECPDSQSCLDLEPVRDMASFDVPDEVTHICL